MLAIGLLLDRRKAEGREQAAEGRREELIFPLPRGSQAPKFIYEKQKDVFRFGAAQVWRHPF